MTDDRAGDVPSNTPISVSPDNPCPFLRAIVSEGFVGGHDVPLGTLSRTVQAASGEKGYKKLRAGIGTRLVALIANGFNPLRLMKSWWSGATLDQLRNGPLDKHGVGSRILDANAHVHEDEIERLASFGKDRPNPMGGGAALPAEHGGDLLVIIGAVLILAGLVLTFVLKGSRGAMAAAACAALAAISLAYTVLVRIPGAARADATTSAGGSGAGGPSPEQIAEMIKVNIQIGFYLCLAALIAAVLFDFMAMKGTTLVAAAAAPPAEPPPSA